MHQKSPFFHATIFDNRFFHSSEVERKDLLCRGYCCLSIFDAIMPARIQVFSLLLQTRNQRFQNLLACSLAFVSKHCRGPHQGRSTRHSIRWRFACHLFPDGLLETLEKLESRSTGYVSPRKTAHQSCFLPQQNPR